MKNVREFSEEKEKEKKAEERTICRKLQEKKSKKTSKKTTTEEIGKRNQITALKFQTGGRDIRHPRPPFWATRSEKKRKSGSHLDAKVSKPGVNG